MGWIVAIGLMFAAAALGFVSRSPGAILFNAVVIALGVRLLWVGLRGRR